jgi:hypothetical protein
MSGFHLDGNRVHGEVNGARLICFALSQSRCGQKLSENEFTGGLIKKIKRVG